jgi:hypothetical protein
MKGSFLVFSLTSQGILKAQIHTKPSIYIHFHLFKSLFLKFQGGEAKFIHDRSQNAKARGCNKIKRALRVKPPHMKPTTTTAAPPSKTHAGDKPHS